MTVLGGNLGEDTVGKCAEGEGCVHSSAQLALLVKRLVEHLRCFLMPQDVIAAVSADTAGYDCCRRWLCAC